MSIRRLLFGLRPSSACALSTRPGVQWTPDFTAGAAGLELETILNRYHRAYRATAVASGALKLVARPEEVRNPRQAWGALALEYADAVYVWRRTRTWQSMLDPGVTSADAALGVASVALGSRAMHVQPQVDGTAWTNRMLAVRVAAFPLGNRHGVPLLAGIGSQVLPHLMRRDRDARRRIISHLTPLLTTAFTQALVLSHQMRRAARVIDARSLRWADAEECRIRSWLTNEAWARASPSTVTPEARAAHLEIVEAGVRRLSRRLRGGTRLGSSVADLVRLVGIAHHHPGAAKVAAGGFTARTAGRRVVRTARVRGVGDVGSGARPHTTETPPTRSSSCSPPPGRSNEGRGPPSSNPGNSRWRRSRSAAIGRCSTTSGSGTATMQALAATIDADIEWFQTSSGGTEVRVVLRPPADPMATHASAAT